MFTKTAVLDDKGSNKSKVVEPCCVVCFEQNPPPVGLAKESSCSSCRASICPPCHVRWLEMTERNGVSPHCPRCRQVIPLDEAKTVLGRPYNNGTNDKDTRVDDVNDGDDLDQLTRDFLKNHTMECAACGAWVMKNGGCNNMTCRCGYTFQWTLSPGELDPFIHTQLDTERTIIRCGPGPRPRLTCPRAYVRYRLQTARTAPARVAWWFLSCVLFLGLLVFVCSSWGSLSIFCQGVLLDQPLDP